MGKVDESVNRLDELRAEITERTQRHRRAGQELGEVEAQLERARRQLTRTTSGGLLDGDPDTHEAVKRLELQAETLRDERNSLDVRLTELEDERRTLIVENADPAWQQYVKARQNEIDKGVQLGNEIREQLRIYRRNLIGRREECERTLQILRREVGLTAPGATLNDLLSGPKAEQPEPQAPRRKIGSEVTAPVIGWRMLSGALSVLKMAIEK